MILTLNIFSEFWKTNFFSLVSKGFEKFISIFFWLCFYSLWLKIQYFFSKFIQVWYVIFLMSRLPFHFFRLVCCCGCCSQTIDSFLFYVMIIIDDYHSNIIIVIGFFSLVFLVVVVVVDSFDYWLRNSSFFSNFYIWK